MGEWTEARFTSFIKSQLRNASRKWKPNNEALKRARIQRGIYLCNGCNQEITTSIKIDGKKHKNVLVDHINPVIDPKKGFTTWDDFINRLFCEIDDLQVLCKDCHDKKTKEENEVAKQRKKKNA